MEPAKVFHDRDAFFIAERLDAIKFSLPIPPHAEEEFHNKDIYIIWTKLDYSAPGWQTAAIDIPQADFRILNSANGFLGFQLFPVAGVDKFYQVANPKLIVYNTAGAPWGTENSTYIYDASLLANFSHFTNVFTDEVNGGVSDHAICMVDFAPCVDGLILNAAPTSYPVSAPTGSRGSVSLPGNTIYLWNSSDFPLFEGRAKMIIDYRIKSVL